MEIQLNNGNHVLIDEADQDLAVHRWSVNGAGYAGRTVQKKVVFMHRIILARFLGRELTSGEICDHINGDILDNRRSNLRLATIRQNAQNQSVRTDNTSGYKGVSQQHNGRWRATICINGKNKHLGYFATAEEASKAYGNAAQQHFGEFARPK